MGKNLFVGNLASGVTDDLLYQTFAAHGVVKSAQVELDRRTGTPRGFGLVEMGTEAEARAAIKALDLKELHGRCMTVNEARPKAGGSGRGRHH